MCRPPCVRAGKLKARCPCCCYVDPAEAAAARGGKKQPQRRAPRTYADAVVPAPPASTLGPAPEPAAQGLAPPTSTLGPASEPAALGLALLCMAYKAEAEAEADAERPEAV